jgi:hypothetical protein
VRNALREQKDLTDSIAQQIEASLKEFASQHKFAMSEEEELARV